MINTAKLQRLQLDLRVRLAAQQSIGEQVNSLSHHVKFGDATDLDRAELAALRKRAAELEVDARPHAALVRNLERYAAEVNE